VNQIAPDVEADIEKPSLCPVKWIDDHYAVTEWVEISFGAGAQEISLSRCRTTVHDRCIRNA
jgi:hypothetical protein